MQDPRLAILIPCHNEEQVIGDTLKALLKADVDRRDIYVVDDRSTDNTAKIIKSLGVNLYTTPINCGKALAQRAAFLPRLSGWWLLKDYDWIIFLDGDTKVDLYFFNRMFLAAKTEPDVDLFVGQVKNAEATNVFSANRAVEYAYGQDVAKHGQSNFGVIFVSPGCASMYKVSTLKTLTIDHLTLAEDMDLTMQVHRSKGKVKYLPDAVVYTQDPANLKDYLRQVLRWYRGGWQVMLKHKVFNLWTHKQKVDVYLILMNLDAMLNTRVTWYLILGIWRPTYLASVFALDIGVSFLIALWGAYRTKRWSLVWRFPLYFWVPYLNLYAYLRSFIEIVVLRKRILAWNKVARYDFTPPQP